MAGKTHYLSKELKYVKKVRLFCGIPAFYL
ncbi:hypothetical protein E2C01_089614 [Portunus trituberculatus]|uniref:Uncharacterized protein n=1 Tax=Portunus trituberculatus TaxID=210409 RepID=A0A5B7JJ96_PORTR|nr:hypothetical protein [Portunus trituberculatus]